MLTFKQFLMSEGAVSPLLVRQPDIKTFNPQAPREEKVSILQRAYQQLLPKLQSIKQRLYSMVRAGATLVHPKSPPTIKIGVKPLPSVVSKVVERGKPVQRLSDLVRCAVLFDSHEECKEFFTDFMRQHHAMIVDKEEKKQGKDKVYGYFGSYHLGVLIDGLACEMQIMTKKLWDFKHRAHKIYTSVRDSGKIDPATAFRSRQIFRTGNLGEAFDAFGEFAEGLEDIG